MQNNKFFFYSFSVLGIEAMASRMLNKYSTTELDTQPTDRYSTSVALNLPNAMTF